MDPSALAGLCALLARGATAQPLPAGVNCPSVIASPSAASAPLAAPVGRVGGGATLAAKMSSPEAREAPARVAFAEAANQGDSGLAAVVYTIMNRLQDGRWGSTVDSVLNARAQFEPVLRAGGSWRNLRPVSDAQRARIDTIINLALEGRLPDLTNGARFFQNAQVVAQREAAGTVSRGLTHFGGAPASAVIGAHTFYAEAGRGGRPRAASAAPSAQAATTVSAGTSTAATDAIFVGENRAFPTSPDPLVAPAAAPVATLDEVQDSAVTYITGADAPAEEPGAKVADAGGIFVLPDGTGSNYAR